MNSGKDEKGWNKHEEFDKDTSLNYFRNKLKWDDNYSTYMLVNSYYIDYYNICWVEKIK